MQADFLTDRLTSLEERIDGVEDQLEIELDHRRNELVALVSACCHLASALSCCGLLWDLLLVLMLLSYCHCAYAH